MLINKEQLIQEMLGFYWKNSNHAPFVQITNENNEVILEEQADIDTIIKYIDLYEYYYMTSEQKNKLAPNDLKDAFNGIPLIGDINLKMSIDSIFTGSFK